MTEVQTETAAEIEQRIAAKQADIEAVAGKLADLTARLLDSTEAQRHKLLQERVLLVADRGAMRDELAELRQRYVLAAIAPYEQAEAEAAALVEVLRAKATAARVAMNAALDEQLRFFNAQCGKFTREQHDKAEAELAGRVAQLRAESRIASDATRHAAFARDHAHDSTLAMRRQLGAGLAEQTRGS